MERPIVHLTAQFGQDKYMIGTLRFQKDKELSYFLEGSPLKKDTALNLNTGEQTPPLIMLPGIQDKRICA